MGRCNSQTKAYIRRQWSLQGRAPLSIGKSCRGEDTAEVEINQSVGFYHSYPQTLTWGVLLSPYRHAYLVRTVSHCDLGGTLIQMLLNTQTFHTVTAH